MTMSAKRILFATDLSAASDEALSNAIDLAKGTGAVLEILHVLELVLTIPFSGSRKAA